MELLLKVTLARISYKANQAGAGEACKQKPSAGQISLSLPSHHHHGLLLRKKRRVSLGDQLVACPIIIQDPQPQHHGRNRGTARKNTMQWSLKWLRDKNSCLGHVLLAWVNEWSRLSQGQSPPTRCCPPHGNFIPQPWMTRTVLFTLVLEKAPDHTALECRHACSSSHAQH